MHSMRLTCVASSSSDLVSDIEDCGKERDIREVRREMCVCECERERGLLKMIFTAAIKAPLS